jgi:hypothetical protein
MTRFLLAVILLGGSAMPQAAMPTPAGDSGSRQTAGGADIPVAGGPGAKVGLVRGVVKRLDPIHDQLLVHAFGGGDVRIAFDPRTQLLSENTTSRLTSISAGSVVSVDTVIDNGRLFARTVRTGSLNGAELNGQVVSYDGAKSTLILRDALSPENVSLRINSNTTVVNRGQAASPQVLSPGMLVRVRFSPAQNAPSNIEIVAERGNSFTFEGRIVAVDLRSQVLALSNDSDQSVHELAIGSLDPISLGLLREGAKVSIQAEFDGDHYKVRTVNLVSRNP